MRFLRSTECIVGVAGKHPKDTHSKGTHSNVEEMLAGPLLAFSALPRYDVF